MRVISVDLAYRNYRDFGAVVLYGGHGCPTYRLVEFTNNHKEPPEPAHTAKLLIKLCEQENSTLLLLDGPQAWKAPDNGLVNSRICERILNTPAKTGLPGCVKPANYLPFVKFAINVFDELELQGWRRFDPANWTPSVPAVIESFPLAAWRSLSIPALPAKKKSRDKDIQGCLQALVDRHLLSLSSVPTHDQLQAIVAGLAGLALQAGNTAGYNIVGRAPLLSENAWREGYIINPIASPL